MSVEALGRDLLGEVKVEGLNEVEISLTSHIQIECLHYYQAFTLITGARVQRGFSSCFSAPRSTP